VAGGGGVIAIAEGCGVADTVGPRAVAVASRGWVLVEGRAGNSGGAVAVVGADRLGVSPDALAGVRVAGRVGGALNASFVCDSSDAGNIASGAADK